MGLRCRIFELKCSLVFVISVTKSYNRGESDQRGHEVSAERSDLCWQRNLCKADQTNLCLFVFICRMCVVVISVCNLSTEPEEESGVSSEISEHTNEDKRSRQSAHLWKVRLQLWDFSLLMLLTGCLRMHLLYALMHLLLPSRQPCPTGAGAEAASPPPSSR